MNSGSHLHSTLKRANPNSSFRPGRFVDSDASNIRHRAEKLSAMHRRERDKIKSIFEFVRDEVVYNFAPSVSGPEDFRASHTLSLGNGFCMQKAALFAALCRASGVPARVGFQNIADYKLVGPFYEMLGGNVITNHGMNAVYLDGRWLRVDCTLDKKLVERKNYRLTEFDGVRDALLPKTDRAGKPHFAILKQSGFYNDMPQFAIRSMLRWIDITPYHRWRHLVHGKDGSM